jgi:hypothetical protein
VDLPESRREKVTGSHSLAGLAFRKGHILFPVSANPLVVPEARVSPDTHLLSQRPRYRASAAILPGRKIVETAFGDQKSPTDASG